MQPSPITNNQWKKVLKSLIYSLVSGFSAGFLLTLTGSLQSGQTDLKSALLNAVTIGGVTGGLNSLAVTIKQLFTEG